MNPENSLTCKQCLKSGNTLTFPNNEALRDHLAKAHNKFNREAKRQAEREERASLFSQFIGKTLTVSLLNGEKFTGKIEKVSTYEILFSNSQGFQLIPKHGLIRLEATELT